MSIPLAYLIVASARGCPACNLFSQPNSWGAIEQKYAGTNIVTKKMVCDMNRAPPGFTKVTSWPSLLLVAGGDYHNAFIVEPGGVIDNLRPGVASFDHEMYSVRSMADLTPDKVYQWVSATVDKPAFHRMIEISSVAGAALGSRKKPRLLLGGNPLTITPDNRPTRDDGRLRIREESQLAHFALAPPPASAEGEAQRRPMRIVGRR
jgi:hypothetical protein